MPIAIDLTGQRFSSLTAVERVVVDGRSQGWRCVCDCGNETILATGLLRQGKMRSCGCKFRDPRPQMRKVPGYATARNQYAVYRHNAKRRSLAFDLTFDEFYALAEQACSYCSAPPTPRQRGNAATSWLCNGIDRVDNDKGYVLDNCVPCCKLCNQRKRAASREDFLNWVRRVYETSIKETNDNASLHKGTTGQR